MQDEFVTLPDASSSYVKLTREGANVTGTGTDGCPSTFLGWALLPRKDDFEPQWRAGDAVCNLSEEDGGVVTLYAVWDDCPWIEASDLYYTLEQATGGFITEGEILRHAKTFDREDGTIPPGSHSSGASFSIPDYDPSDFTQMQGDSSCTENLTVRDHVGNSYEKQITVHIVDSEPKREEPKGTTRFISAKYAAEPFDRGGLEDDSLWRTDPGYSGALQGALSRLEGGSPVRRYEFSREEVVSMKEYVLSSGVGNYRTPGALEQFCARFLR